MTDRKSQNPFTGHVPPVNAPPHGFHSAKQVHEAFEQARHAAAAREQIDDFDATAVQMRDIYARSPPIAETVTISIPAGAKLHGAKLSQTLAAVSSVAPTSQQTSIKELEPIFKKFTDTEVAVYAMDNLPIGPRAGIENVPESTLKAIASVEVQRRGRISDRTWYVVGGGLAAVVTGVVAWMLRGVFGA